MRHTCFSYCCLFVCFCSGPATDDKHFCDCLFVVSTINLLLLFLQYLLNLYIYLLLNYKHWAEMIDKASPSHCTPHPQPNPPNILSLGTIPPPPSIISCQRCHPQCHNFAFLCLSIFCSCNLTMIAILMMIHT